jgi:hypothetical protein
MVVSVNLSSADVETDLSVVHFRSEREWRSTSYQLELKCPAPK